MLSLNNSVKKMNVLGIGQNLGFGKTGFKKFMKSLYNSTARVSKGQLPKR